MKFFESKVNLNWKNILKSIKEVSLCSVVSPSIPSLYFTSATGPRGFHWKWRMEFPRCWSDRFWGWGCRGRVWFRAKVKYHIFTDFRILFCFIYSSKLFSCSQRWWRCWRKRGYRQQRWICSGVRRWGFRWRRRRGRGRSGLGRTRAAGQERRSRKRILGFRWWNETKEKGQEITVDLSSCNSFTTVACATIFQQLHLIRWEHSILPWFVLLATRKFPGSMSKFPGPNFHF